MRNSFLYARDSLIEAVSVEYVEKILCICGSGKLDPRGDISAVIADALFSKGLVVRSIVRASYPWN